MLLIEKYFSKSNLEFLISGENEKYLCTTFDLKFAEIRKMKFIFKLFCLIVCYQDKDSRLHLYAIDLQFTIQHFCCRFLLKNTNISV